ncbi:MAG: type II secretion system GspH family protein [Hydrogenimonas sp.]|nr:type II secretion system GspH family protein [Hydrogenimonas sp.]
MKKAFTLLELVFVMLVVGIMTALIIPRFSDSKLQEAADQIISHIRYTQHLAMIDDRYDPTDQDWHKTRWQMSFRSCINGDLYYVVGRDLDKQDGVEKDGSAINPTDRKHLFVSNNCDLAEDETSEIMITKKYGITNLVFSNSCGNNKYIAFDHLGRPYQTTLGDDPLDLIHERCTIKFTADSGSFTIAIEPETGYVHKL